MATQIVTVNPLQAAKVIATMYFLLGLLLSPFVFAAILMDPDTVVSAGTTLLVTLVLPFIYALVSFIFIPIICWVYNKVSERIGGLEITIRETSQTSLPETSVIEPQ